MSQTQKGNGQLQILTSNLNDSLKIEEIWAESKPVTYSFYLVSKDSISTNLTIVGKGKMGFISNLFPFIYKWKMKSNLKSKQSRLADLLSKRYTENSYYGHEIKLVDINKKFYLIKRSEVEFKKIRQYYTQTISALYQTALNKNISISGPPCGLFFKWDDVNKKSDMAAALPTYAELKHLDIETLNINASRAAMIEFQGDVKKSSSAHRALEDYLLDHSLLNDSPIVEEYVTDPNLESDINKWVTNIIYYTSKK
jgi:effector-binding domain-containing protein